MYILKRPAAGIFVRTPSFIRPSPLEGYFQGMPSKVLTGDPLKSNFRRVVHPEMFIGGGQMWPPCLRSKKVCYCPGLL